MRFISTRTHGVLDYVTAAFMIVAPWLLNFDGGGAEAAVFLLLGGGGLLYSLFTRYELGAVKAIPMRLHLWLDFFSGLLLASSPWLLGFADYVSTPHVVTGIFGMLVALFSHKKSAVAYDDYRAPAQA